MRFNSFYLLLLLGVVSFFASCKREKEAYVFSVCLIVDGTDAQINKNAVPRIHRPDIEMLVDSIFAHGYGNLYLTYVDECSANNAVAELSWYQKRPKKIEIKAGDGSQKQEEKMEENETNLGKYRADLLATKNVFFENVDSVLSLAYAKEVTHRSQGSDVYGAVNKAISYVEADRDANVSLILLVSDMEHNTKNRELTPIPRDTKLFVVGTSIDDKTELRPTSGFATFPQVIRYISSQEFLNTCKRRR